MVEKQRAEGSEKKRDGTRFKDDKPIWDLERIFFVSLRENS